MSSFVNSIGISAGTKKYSYALYAVIVIVSLASLLIFSKKYFYAYIVISCSSWNFGQKDIFSEIRKLEKSYKWECIDNINYSNELQILDS